MNEWGADPVEVIGRLNRLSADLDRCTDALANVERELDPLEKWYSDAVDRHELMLWDVHVDSDLNVKLPPEAMREKLARRKLREDNPKAMDRYDELVALRTRGEKKIARLAKTISAQQSVLSASKTLAEIQ